MNITVQNEKLHKINRGMFGLFFEDINYAADGGLYAEMIENRNFEAYSTTGINDAYANAYDGLYGWYKYPTDCPFVALETRTTNPLTKENPHYLHLLSRRANSGFTNKSYDGLTLAEGESYNGKFYANTPEYDGEIIVSIEKDGDVIFKKSFSAVKEDKWKEYDYSFVSPVSVHNAKLVVTLSASGAADFDFISLFPENAVNGIFRRDLADLLKGLKPGFLRFPGGCIIEGNNLENRYRWKDSVGDPKTRKANWNRWSVHDNSEKNGYRSRYTHYNQTYGLGYYEYFLLCEYIGAAALPVVSVGLACQYMSTEMVELEDPAFREYIDDALDLIEFANGDESTKWGHVRVKMGHPAPFNLKFIGIGNEQWETDKSRFFERYRRFEEAIHEKYPDMLLIGSAGPDVHTARYEAAWNFYRENKNKKNFAYAIDEHYYMSPEWFFTNTKFYDDYDRDVKVFSGEYAAHPVRTGSVQSGNTLVGALSEAAFLTGVERNSDVVIMASYAPLFARLGYVQWAPDMIWFNDEIAYGSPSYHVQKMYSVNSGSDTLAYSLDFDPEELRVYVSSVFDSESNEVILKVVNATEEDKKIDICFNGFNVDASAHVALLTGKDFNDFNTAENPNKVSEKEFDADIRDSYVFEKRSFYVLRFKVK